MKTLKQLFLILIVLTSTTKASDLIYFYPIQYENQKDLFIKLAYPIENAFITYEKKDYYFENQGVLIPNIPIEETIAFNLMVMDNYKAFPLTEEVLSYENKPSTNIFLDQNLYKALASWSTKEDQNIPLNNYLVQLLSNKQIAPEELVSFTQQFYKFKATMSKTLSPEENIQQFFKAKAFGEDDSPCNCNFVLNHFSSAAPVRHGSGTYGNGYNYLNYPGVPTGRLSEIINVYKSFDSNSPKWHRWYSNEKGPAHDLFLRTYDSNNSFNYQWSTLGINNNGANTPSPNYAYNSFQFMCVGQELFLPKNCNCTKQFCTLYEYNNILKVIARKLKALSNVSSTAEELAIVTLTNSSGVSVVDANRNRAYTECNGDFNFEFLGNLFDLAGAVVDVVIDVQDTTNGPPINDVPEAIENIGGALLELVSTPPIIVKGDCEEKYLQSALLRNFECFKLRANDPTTLTLQSYTFLGVAGDRKWDNYAIARSDFRIQTLVLTGSEEDVTHCCSDKLGMHLYANMGGPVSETDHNNNVTGAYYLFGPWDNFTQIGYLPVIPNNAHRGYFIYEDNKRDCAPIKPGKKSLNSDNLFSSITMQEENQVKETSTESKHSNGVSLASAFQSKLYPNPSHDHLNIEISGLNPEANLSVIVYNSMGLKIEEIYSGTVLGTNQDILWETKQSDLSAGVYYVVIRENNLLMESIPFMYKP